MVQPSFWFELTSFLRALFKNWQALILGGILAVAVTLWQWFGSPVGKIWYGVILILTFFPAVYLTWRDEFRRASTRAAEIISLKEALTKASQQGPSPIWKPKAALESHDDGTGLRNELILKDSQQFELHSVELLSPDRAKLADVSIGPGGQISNGFRVHITHTDILKVWNRGFRAGSVRYEVRRGDAPWTGTIPFAAEAISIRNTQWIRLLG